MNPFLAILMILTASFLILIVLIQRGRGGGLAGAFGGMGGQSAFGTKAGDLFTRITIGVAAFWIFLCIVTLKLTVNRSDQFDPNLGRDASANLPASSSGTSETPAGTTAPTANDGKDSGSTATSGAGESKPSESSSTAPPADSSSTGAQKSESSK